MQPAPSGGGAHAAPLFDQESPRAGNGVDLGNAASSVLRYWWVVLVGVLVMLAFTAVRTGAGSVQHESSATVYIGAPVSSAGVRLDTVATTPAAAIERVKSNAAIAAAAKASGLTRAEIRAGLTAQPVQAPIASKTQSPPSLVKITMKTAKRDDARAVTAALSTWLVDDTSKLGMERVTAREKQLDSMAKAIQEERQLQKEVQRQIAARPGGDDASVLALMAGSLGTSVSSAEATLAQASADVALARDVELSRVTHPASVRRLTPATRTPTLLMAALVGAAIGVAGALILGSRRNRGA